MKDNIDKILSVRISQSDYDKLEKIADSDARSVSEIVRLLIRGQITGKINITSNVEQKPKRIVRPKKTTLKQKYPHAYKKVRHLFIDNGWIHYNGQIRGYRETFTEECLKKLGLWKGSIDLSFAEYEKKLPSNKVSSAPDFRKKMFGTE